MALEKHLSLRRASELIGVSHHTLKAWLRQAGILVPSLGKGRKAMIRERDVEMVVAKRRDARAWVAK